MSYYKARILAAGAHSAWAQVTLGSVLACVLTHGTEKQSMPRFETPQQREGSRPSKRSSALVEHACRRIALTELREALGGSARCADQDKKTYSFPCVPQGKTLRLQQGRK